MRFGPTAAVSILVTAAAGLAASETDLAALRGRLADQTAQRDRLRAQLSGVEGSTVDFSTLQTRVLELQNNYQLYSQKKNEAEIADKMDQQQLVNVAVAERPTYTAKPYRPQVLLNVALRLFTALFLGGAVCSLRSWDAKRWRLRMSLKQFPAYSSWRLCPTALKSLYPGPGPARPILAGLPASPPRPLLLHRNTPFK